MCYKVESFIFYLLRESFCMCYKAESFCMCYKAESRRSHFVCVIRWSHCVGVIGGVTVCYIPQNSNDNWCIKCHKRTFAIFDVPHDVKHCIYFL